MQFSTTLLSIALLSTFAAATPVVPALQPRATPCTSAQNQLAKGIDDNIAIQKKEQSAINAIGQAQQKDLSGSEWASMKSNFINIINQGVDVRKNNQKIAPKNSKAVAGLNKVAGAQADELKLAQGLTGKAAQDSNTVSTLKTDFAGGIKQNQQNKKDALDGCTN